MPGVPSVVEVREWLLVAPTSITDAQLQLVIDGELDGQRKLCRVPVEPESYPDSLREGLYRRVGRFLASRQIPLGLYGDPASEYGATRLAMFDPEIERTEGPYRIVVFG